MAFNLFISIPQADIMRLLAKAAAGSHSPTLKPDSMEQQELLRQQSKIFDVNLITKWLFYVVECGGRQGCRVEKFSATPTPTPTSQFKKE